MTAAELARDALGEVAEAAVHPVLPEDADGRGADAGAEWCDVGLDHAKGAVDGPEEEEDDEHVVRIPEAFVVGPPRLLHRRDDHAHQRNEHDIARPARSGHEIRQQPAVDAEVVLARDLRKVVPVRNGVDPRPEDNGPRGGDVEGDVLVELDNPVQGRLAEQRDEGSAHGEEDDGDVDVEHQRGGPRNDKGEAEVVARGLQAVLHGVVDAGEGEDEGVGEHEDKDESGLCEFSDLL